MCWNRIPGQKNRFLPMNKRNAEKRKSLQNGQIPINGRTLIKGRQGERAPGETGKPV